MVVFECLEVLEKGVIFLLLEVLSGNCCLNTYIHQNKDIWLVGIIFSKETRNIVGFQSEEICGKDKDTRI